MSYAESSTESKLNRTLPKKRIIRRYKEIDAESVRKYLNDTQSS
jgi:hypothetical protein